MPLITQPVEHYKIPLDLCFRQDTKHSDFTPVTHVGQHRPKCLRITRHFHSDVESLQASQVFLRFLNRPLADIKGDSCPIFLQAQADMGLCLLPLYALRCSGGQWQLPLFR